MKLLLVGSGADFSTKDIEDGYRAALKALGHEVIEYQLSGRLGAAKYELDTAWRRMGSPKDNKYSAGDVVYAACRGILERALRFEVDWVLVISGMYVHPDWFVMLHRAHIKTAVVLTESPYEDEQQAEFAALCNVAFTNERTSVDYLRKAQPQTYYLPHAYDPAKHHTNGGSQYAGHDAVFVGTGFMERINTLAGVDWRGLDLGLYGNWALLPSRHKLRSHLCGGIMANADTAEMYRRSKVGLNLYRTSMQYSRKPAYTTVAESLNPRALELAACGAFTVSDYRAEVTEVFGDAVPTFQSSEELGELVRYYAAHDVERQALAARLPGLVRGHTYQVRTAELIGRLWHV